MDEADFVEADYLQTENADKYDITTTNKVTLDKTVAPDLLAKIVELEAIVTELTVNRDRFQVVALIILGVLAITGLGCTTWLLAAGVTAEAALAVFGLSNLCAGAIAGALTFGKRG
jgi:hypothetical protein